MWGYIIVFALTLALSYAMQPKPQKTPPASIKDIEAPTAEEGRDIPVLFGRRIIKGPNVTWYGDLRTKPIRSKGGKK